MGQSAGGSKWSQMEEAKRQKLAKLIVPRDKAYYFYDLGYELDGGAS